MATLWTHRESNIRKTWLLITIFLVFITTLGWFFSKVYGNPAIFAIAFILSVVMSLGSYWFSDKIVVATTGARPLSEKEAPEVYNIVENLAITAGLPKPRIFIVDSVQPNAFATGRNAEHAIVAVTTGILQIMSRSELEGVIAHEMSHIGNRDMLVSTVVVVLVGVVQLLSDIFLRQMRWGIGGNDRDRGQAQMVFVLIGIALAILSPIAAMLIQLAVSRKREYLADASGALLTRYPDGLASALQKISADPTPLKAATNATAHLYISNPFKGKKISTLFMTHPPIQDRIKALSTIIV